METPVDAAAGGGVLGRRQLVTRPQQAPVVNVVAAVLVLLSVVPIYVAQRLSADTATESRI